MLLLGLTGGIGSGKSTVGGLLRERGAVVIDADQITRELQRPGQPVFEAIVAQFGDDVVTDAGDLDRDSLADLVFNDDDARRRLEAIVHPAVAREIATRLEMETDSEHVVVLDVPLLVETSLRKDLAGVIVVDADPETALQRLVAQRGLRESDARARMGVQASRSERLAVADFVIENDGTIKDLEAQVERCWAWVEGLRRGSPSSGPEAQLST